MWRYSLVIIAWLALLWSPLGLANSISAENSGEEPAKVLVFGDSLSAAYGMSDTESWVGLLEERLSERNHPWRVANASISGETTAGGRERLPEVLERENPDLVILALGGNDGLRGLSPRAMRDNLEAMLEVIDTAGAQALLLGIRIPPNYGPQYTQRFEAVFTDLARERGLVFEPFFLHEIALRDGMIMDDGIHPTPEAQPYMLEAVWPHLEPMMRGIEACLDDAVSVSERPAQIRQDVLGEELTQYRMNIALDLG
ncbi:arylesterase [Thioalkalivibrio thiocyanoxidans]|uniref:arylesterase n=1 Tax=Thioalkalivibrio thiocyanoxidans TaxID=152475 RepID=UPI000370F0AB|nr:arylesterase [Thioalkalivibrio thiocyanoxidans]